MITLIPRQSASTGWQVATPVMAVLATMIAGGLLFAMLGHDPVAAIRTIFWDPLFGPAAGYSRPQLLVKAGPLILIASGLVFVSKPLPPRARPIVSIVVAGRSLLRPTCAAGAGGSV